MKVKIFLGLIFMGVVFALSSWKATPVNASVTVGAWFSNTYKYGATIPITVWYQFTNKLDDPATSEAEPGSAISSVKSVYIALGSSATVFAAPQATNQSPYYVRWWTDCKDPTTQLDDYRTTEGFYGIYDQDVSCKTTNGEPSITSISCPSPGTTLTLNWQMTGGGPYNVDYYWLFKSKAPDTYPDDNNPLKKDVNHVNVSSASASQSWSATAGSTYYLRVSAVSPQGVWSSPDYANVTCAKAAAGTVAPTQPSDWWVDSQGCSGGGNYKPDATFKWNSVNGATQYAVYIWDPAKVISGTRYSKDDRWVRGSQVAGTSYTWNDLPNSTALSWSVGAWTSGGFSGIYRWESFTTWDCERGIIWGRIIKDDDGDGVQDAGEERITTTPGCPGYVNANFYVQVRGPSDKNPYPNTCPGTNPVRYETPEIKTGNYNVKLVKPSGWRIVKVGQAGDDPAWTVNSDNTVSGYLPQLVSNPKDVRFYVMPPCSNTSAGTNILKGCMWNGTSFNTSDGNALDGNTASVPVANTFEALDRDWSSNPVNLFVGGDSGDTFSARWKGNFTFKAGGYTFYLSSDDGARLKIDGTTVINSWRDRGYTYHEDSYYRTFSSPSVHLVEVEYYQNCCAKRITLDWQYSVAPLSPSNLEVTQACTALNDPEITFSWDDALSETKYKLEVSGSSSWATAGVKELPDGTTSFKWSPFTALDSGSPTFPLKDTNYWWAVSSYVSGAWRPRVYYTTGAGDASTAPGDSFRTSDCKPNLQVSAFSVPDGNPGQQVDASVTVNNVGLGYTATTKTADDIDGDGFSNDMETRMGTDPNLGCPATGTANDEDPDAWPPDFNDNRIIQIDDVSAVTARFNTYDPRYDFNGDGTVNISDSFFVNSLFNQSCAGSFGEFEVAINLDMDVSPMTCETSESTQQFTTPMAPGESRNLTIQVTLPSITKQYKAVAMADSDCAVVETNDNDNTLPYNYLVAGFDLSAEFVPNSFRNSQNIQTIVFQPGEEVSVKVKITNTSLATVSSPATTLDFWADGLGLDFPNCSANPPTSASISASETASVPALNIPGPGDSTEVTVNFTVGNGLGYKTAYAYVIPGCDRSPPPHPDSNWANNETRSGQSYLVDSKAWFETVSGDLGSGGNISLQINPPRKQSSYLLARAGTDANASSQKWTLNNYNQPLIAGDSVYDYLAERFKQRAQDAGPAICALALLRTGFNFCAGNAVASGISPSGNTVWFIDGNLTISGNTTLASSADTLIVIASGNITVETEVTRIDGIYIAGATFRDTTDNNTIVGDQLVINGAVYAKSANLNRHLTSDAACTYHASTQTVEDAFVCSDQDEPAEVVIFDPKYLVLLSDPDPTANLLGTPAVSWKEVAP